MGTSTADSKAFNRLMKTQSEQAVMQLKALIEKMLHEEALE